MYEGYFRLRRTPFSLAPDPNHLFLSEGHREALAGLDYFVRSPSAYACLLGAPGLGKSTLAASFLARLQKDQYAGLFVSPTIASYPEILRRIAARAAPGGPPPTRDAEELARVAAGRLDAGYRRGRRFVLVLDEAHLLPVQTLERLRLFVDHVSYGRDPLKLLLIGPPELDGLLREQCPALHQRIGVPLTLAPLGTREGDLYLQAKIRTAGAALPEDVFTPGALRVLARSSRGVPRVINALANLTLVEGYADQERPVGARTARRAVASLGLKARGGSAAPLAAALLLALALPSALLYLAFGTPSRARFVEARISGFLPQPGRAASPVLALEARVPEGGPPGQPPAVTPALEPEIRPAALPRAEGLVPPPLSGPAAQALRGPVPGAVSVEAVSAQPRRLQGDAQQEGRNDLPVARP